ncbi:stimulated by retinoic acid gene 8 protein homolog [Ammospiza maritima maritima]
MGAPRSRRHRPPTAGAGRGGDDPAQTSPKRDYNSRRALRAFSLPHSPPRWRVQPAFFPSSDWSPPGGGCTPIGRPPLFWKQTKGSHDEADVTAFCSEIRAYQVLRKAKTSIQKLEQTLCSLLKMKASCSLEDGSPSSLEEVREEYVRRQFGSQSTTSASEDMSESDSAIWYLLQECEKQTLEEYEKPELIQFSDTLSPDLVEFERYLYFYKHTVDLLVEHGIVCTGEVPLPEVSTAISHLWQELSEESRDSILQYCSQRDFLMDPKAACPEPACTEGSVRDSGGNSEEASGSSVSTPEEVMFEDAFDVAAGFLDRSKAQGLSSQSSAFASCTSENPEDHQRLYVQVTDFLKHLFFTKAQFCQEEDLHYDHETVMLRCTETFDDEDF